ncbi:hypothetical protein SAMD00019534_089570 [Acytostelium subglobosum LB1]|uniref:hypothetical protein n=1 Tax=Acytostelium subglobosum LB1 TaxID=1410327 RepID=UPI000644F943|nr:hypothetical protein SAMD00019534_089570 [Acytostelium subglobosum LB1]GAM25782.1 hypothetical protein SAMD00019534_089570 [Acytostelium subglobosum LB1]|eukprot:XP_012751300.1 hypothetical protein SAMD00019534_089570 [Acytostelium subglobosum LB1]
MVPPPPTPAAYQQQQQLSQRKKKKEKRQQQQQPQQSQSQQQQQQSQQQPKTHQPQPQQQQKIQRRQQQRQQQQTKDKEEVTIIDQATLELKRKEIQDQKVRLPVYTARDALLDNIRKNQTVVVISETGTGKTTQIPQYLREDGWTKKGVIAITQPRRVAAISISKRVSDEIGCKLGDEVGYCVRFDDQTNEQTKLKYMTDGMLVREAMIDPSLSKYSVIILDEAHERTLNTDVLFALIKSIQAKRPSLRIVIMSATLDAELFSAYFNKAPILYIEGRQFPVRLFYSSEVQKDYLDAALVTVLQIHLELQNGTDNNAMITTLDGSDDDDNGDILVFLTGREEIDNLEKLLLERIPRLPPNAKKLLVCPIYAAMPQEQQMKVFERAPKGTRKVIIATNIAETSLTINGIRYVVDTGVVKSRLYNPKIGVDSLTVIPISKASAQQRTGRAGREFPGQCYRLYTEETYGKLDESSIPEIKRSNIANVILQLKTIGVDDILGFDFLERPPLSAIQKSLEQLYCLDALDHSGALTTLGRKMSQFPLEPIYSKTLIKSEEFECVEEVLIVISMLSVESIFYTPRDKKSEVEAIKKIFFSAEGDHLTLLNVFREFQRVNGNQQWCYDHFINIKSMDKVVNVFNQLLEYCQNSNMKIESCGNELERVRRCFITGFFLNVAALQPDKKYRTMVDNREIHIHPTSFMFDIKPDYILYNELTVTSKAFVRNVIPIEPSWLPELCPKYYGSRPSSTSSATNSVQASK